jgi:epsilon-lactone hydrolase
MRSWQVRLFELYFHLERTFSRGKRDVDVDRERADLDGLGSLFKLPGNVRALSEPDVGVPAEWLIPTNVMAGRAVLYLHGGSYISGSINSHRTLAANIALACKARVLLIDYRLAPEHPYPAAIEDALTAYRWLLSANYDPHHLAVAGDSAGGGLSLALLLSLRDASVPLPAACVCISPLTDMAFTGESWESNAAADLVIYAQKELEFARMYLGTAEPQDPLASPLYADLQGLPPLLVQVGGSERLLSDSTRLVERAQLTGVNAVLDEWDKMQHVWHFAAPFIPEGRRAIERIGEFVDRWA